MTRDTRTDTYEKFTLPAAATPEDIRTLFRRVGRDCQKQGATRALVFAASTLPVPREALEVAVLGLSEPGSASGFKLACVAQGRQAYEDFAHAGDVGRSAGITSRVFFDEANAVHWLAS